MYQPALISLILLTLLSCKTNSEMQENPMLRLNDIWALKSMSHNGLEVEADFSTMEVPVLEIYVEDKRIGGNDGCNSFFGNIDLLDDESVLFGSIGSTKMVCPNMVIPNAFNRALIQAKSYRLKGLELIFYDETSQEILRFHKVD